jgi:hypothetical protein
VRQNSTYACEGAALDAALEGAVRCGVSRASYSPACTHERTIPLSCRFLS